MSILRKILKDNLTHTRTNDENIWNKYSAYSTFIVSPNFNNIFGQVNDPTLEKNCGINPHAPPCCLPQTQDPMCTKQPDMYGSFLSGEKEIPPVNTNATGLAFLTHNEISDPIKDVKVDIIKYDLTFKGLSPLSVHIHQGKEVENGPVVATLYTFGIVPCCLPGEIRDGDLQGPLQGKPVSALIDLMNSGKAYINMHTEAHPDGEIRGQIMPLIFILPSSNSTNTQ
jgi:hypothetical protein